MNKKTGSKVFNEDNFVLELIRYNEELLENPKAEYKICPSTELNDVDFMRDITGINLELSEDVKNYILLDKDPDLINNVIRIKIDTILHSLTEDDIDYCCKLIKLYNVYNADSSIDPSDSNDDTSNITKVVYWGFCYRNMDCIKFRKVVETLLEYNYRVKPNELKLGTMITDFYESSNYKLTDNYLELFDLMNVDILEIKDRLFKEYGQDIYESMINFLFYTFGNNNSLDLDNLNINSVRGKILPIIDNIDRNDLYAKLNIILSECNINSQEDIEDCIKKIFNYINIDCTDKDINKIITLWSYVLLNMIDKYDELHNIFLAKKNRYSDIFADLSYIKDHKSYDELIRLNKLFELLSGKNLLEI